MSLIFRQKGNCSNPLRDCLDYQEAALKPSVSRFLTS